MRDILHFLDGEQDIFQRQARPAAKLVTRQSNSDVSDLLSGVIFQPHAQTCVDTNLAVAVSEDRLWCGLLRLYLLCYTTLGLLNAIFIGRIGQALLAEALEQLVIGGVDL